MPIGSNIEAYEYDDPSIDYDSEICLYDGVIRPNGFALPFDPVQKVDEKQEIPLPFDPQQKAETNVITTPFDDIQEAEAQ